MATMKVGAAPSDWEDEALQSQIATAQALRNKGLNDPTGQMIGDWYMAKSPWAILGQTAGGGLMEQAARGRQGEIQQGREQQVADWLRKRPTATTQTQVANPAIGGLDEAADIGNAPQTIQQTVTKPAAQMASETQNWGLEGAQLRGALPQAIAAGAAQQFISGPEKALEHEAALKQAIDVENAKEKNRDVKAPTIKQTSVANDMVQDQQFDTATKQWVNIGVPYHRFAKQLPTIINNGGTANDLDPGAIDFMAKQALLGDTSVLTGLARTKGALAKVRNRMATMASEEGISPEEAMLRGAEYQGTKAGQRLLGTRGTGIELAANEADKMIALVRDSATKMNAGDYPSLNAVENAVSKGVGGTQVVELNARLNGLVNTYARAISPSGVPTVSDKAHAREVINNAMSKGQLNVALDAMQQEMDAAKAGVRETKASLRDKKGALPNATAAAGGKQETKTYQGKTYRLKPGMPRNKQDSWEVVTS